jgi:hypothetical protein
MRLVRCTSTEWGTFGRLEPLGLYTCELPWLANAPGKSCIPPGVYKLVLTWSPRFRKPLYEVQWAPARTGIRIHSANFPSQLLGCIALGERLGYIEGKRAVLLSSPAVRKFMEWAGGQTLDLEVMYA